MSAQRILRSIASNSWKTIKAFLFWLQSCLRMLLGGVRRIVLSAHAWVAFVAIIISALIAYYILSDHYTPFTTEAYVQAYVVQVAPRIEGQVVHVNVQENQMVGKGDLLFEIDRKPFEYQLALIEAKRVTAVQQVAQMESELAASRADDDRLAAEEAYARVVHEQEQMIFKKDATTDRKYVEAVQKSKAARAALDRSRAHIRKAEQALSARIGEEHALVAEVEAQLGLARLNLEWTRVYAPCDGLVTDLQLREGTYTHIGHPAMTLIDKNHWLVIANFRENALRQLRIGQRAEVAFRGLPGKIFCAQVTSVGWGVSQGQGVPSGQLPEVRVPASWIPPAQRFQVRLDLHESESIPMRVGMTGSVAVYTEKQGVLNEITGCWHRVIAWLYHL